MNTLYEHQYLPTKPNQVDRRERRTIFTRTKMYIHTINNKDEYSQGLIFARKYIASSKEPTQIGIFTTDTHTFVAFAVHEKNVVDGYRRKEMDGCGDLSFDGDLFYHICT